MAGQLWLRWPSLLAVIFLLLNVDYVLMPALVSLGVRGYRLMICAMLAATGEVLYWHWYAGWFGRTIKQSRPAQTVARQFQFTGKLREVEEWWQRTRAVAFDLWYWLEDHLHSQAKVDSGMKQQMLIRVTEIIKRTHIWAIYPIMVILGFMPMGWAVGIVIARVHTARWLLIPLLASNAIKTYAIGLLYIALPWWLKLSFISLIVGAFVWGVWQSISSKRRIRDKQSENTA